MAKRKKKKQKAKELTDPNVIDIDAKREERRRRLKAEAEASRAKRGEKSIMQEMLDDISRGDEPQEIERSDKKNGRKKKKKRSKSVSMKICIAVVIVVLVGLCFSIGNIISLKIQQSEAERQLAELKEEKAALEKQVAQLGSAEYMEKQAREWLKMAKQGEIIYVTDGDEDTNE